MSEPTTYRTVARRGEGAFSDRGSRFVGVAVEVVDEDAVRRALETVRAAHPKASHHCVGWRLGTDGSRWRATDDGEPSGTAGRPILGRIDARGLTDVLVVVVRYYGGQKLGASGLIQAYRTAAEAALEDAGAVERPVMRMLRSTCDFDRYNDWMHGLMQLGVAVRGEHFDTRCHLEITHPLAVQDAVHRLAARLDVDLDAAT